MDTHNEAHITGTCGITPCRYVGKARQAYLLWRETSRDDKTWIFPCSGISGPQAGSFPTHLRRFCLQMGQWKDFSCKSIHSLHGPAREPNRTLNRTNNNSRHAGGLFAPFCYLTRCLLWSFSLIYLYRWKNSILHVLFRVQIIQIIQIIQVAQLQLIYSMRGNGGSNGLAGNRPRAGL